MTTFKIKSGRKNPDQDVALFVNKHQFVFIPRRDILALADFLNDHVESGIDHAVTAEPGQ